MNETATRILDAAETMIRDGGYYGFSFRQIADQLSIKSASVHYHYPTKEALAAAVADRYTERFLQALGQPEVDGALLHYVSLFKQALKSDGRACLCCILAGEAGKIPESLCKTLRGFRDKNIVWLEKAVGHHDPDRGEKQCQEAAVALFSGLEGGMTFAALHGQPDHFDEVVSSLLNLIGVPE
ncbi:MAG: TetR/AcrR family transcriptional regulator [Verrucomicrobiota bacterium]